MAVPPERPTGAQSPNAADRAQSQAAWQKASAAAQSGPSNPNAASAKPDPATAKAVSALFAKGTPSPAAATPLPLDEKPNRSGAGLRNPPLHRLAETTFPMTPAKLKRGFIIRRASRAALGTSGQLPDAKSYQFHFLYNPEFLSINTAIFTAVLPPAAQNPKDKGTARFPGQEGVDISLMVDRSMEAYDQGIKTRGTLDDVDALYRVLNGNVGNPGFLFLSSIEIFWGHDKNTLPSFKGYCTNVSIYHSKFNANMTPIRSVFTLSVSRLVGRDTLRNTRADLGLTNNG